MKYDISLWSADLGALRESMARLEPYADSWHFDVADGHFVPSLLFFPDLVAQLRAVSRKPFHIHLMTVSPENWVEAFAEAGANRITVHVEADPGYAIEMIRRRGLQAGIALRVETLLADAEPYLAEAESVLLLNTRAGVKGQGLEGTALERMREMAARRRGWELIADGAIRRETVPLLRDAGADVIVPGSLAFQDPAGLASI